MSHETSDCKSTLAGCVQRLSLRLRTRYLHMSAFNSKLASCETETYGTVQIESCRALYQQSMAVLDPLNKRSILVISVLQVGGKGAVSAKMSSTKGSVINLHRRGADLLARSESRKPRLDFREMEEDTSSVGGTGVTAATTASWPSGVESQVEKRNGRSSGSGQGAVGAGGSNNEARVERIGVLLSAVPLSKLKIVIGKDVHAIAEERKPTYCFCPTYKPQA